MDKRISLATPHMSDEGYEKEYIKEAFDTNWIAPLGANVTGFENDLKQYLGAESVVALSSGTAAIHLALILAGVKEGDKVFCQDLTFAATVNPIIYQKAEPVFIDSEYDTWNMDPVALEKAFEKHGVPKAVMVVHLYGIPAKMKEIVAICDKYNVPLIEDAAEAVGTSYEGKKCGTFGRYGILSFNGNKIITTSGGGALVCADSKDAVKAVKLATQAREPVAWYQHEEIGYNYRMSNICAGIGRGQMKVLEQRVQKKKEIYEAYSKGLANVPVEMMPMPENADSNCWLSSIILNEYADVTPSGVISCLNEANIEARHVWKPMHMQPIFEKYDYVTVSSSSISEDLFYRGICLPSDTKMESHEIEYVIDQINKCFKLEI